MGVHYSDDITSTTKSNTPAPSNRYKKKTILTDKDMNSYRRMMRANDYTFLPSSGDTTFTVYDEFIGRPDLIALDFYGDPKHYWVILAANNLAKVMDITDGMQLRVPPLELLYGINGALTKQDYE